MRLIAHRGIIDGDYLDKENTYAAITTSILKGYDAEVDVRWHNNQLYFGHDVPQEKVDPEFIFLFENCLWLHCKDFESLEYLFSINYKNSINFFFHDTDDYTITSKGHFWTYPKKKICQNSAIVCKEKKDLSQALLSDAYAVCSPIVGKILKKGQETP
jgi:hypothetical protein